MLPAVLCPGFLPGRSGDWVSWRKRVLPSWIPSGVLCPFHCPIPTDMLNGPCSPLPCPCLPAHCVGTSDFMKFLRSHLHPAALKSHPAWGVEAAGRNQETTNNTKRLGDASVLGILMLGTPPTHPTTKENG